MTGAFHRTVWRWHFWAGLIVAPFLLILSATGAIYLFGDELNDAIHPELRFVPPHDTSVPASRMIRAAVAAVPGTPGRIDLPAASDRPATVTVATAAGPVLRVPVDPGSGRVLGAIDEARTLVGWANDMHGSLMLGTWGDRIVELAACWTLVLLATGLILWWPRGRWRAAGTLWPRFAGGGRRFWRGLHGPVGLWAALLIGFLVVTGLPWSGVSGDLLQRASAAAGVGYPATYRTHGAPQSMKQALGAAPWTLEAAPMPLSGAHAGHGASVAAGVDAAAIAGVDRVVALLAARGLTGDYQLHLPAGPRGVYTAYTYPDRPQGQRTVYVDRYAFRTIGPEVRFAAYGVVGRAVELGVQIHMGNYWGRANQLVMLAACVAIWLLVGSGVAMWWKRRPRGQVGAPPPLSGARARALVATLVVAGLLLPLFGGSLLAVLLVDRLAAPFGRGAA